MSLNLSDTLVIGISATALFDLGETDAIFQEMIVKDPDAAMKNYRDYMLSHEDEMLKPGTGYPLVKALLELNRFKAVDDAPLVEVVILSRNSPETGLRILKSIRKHNLSISRSAFTAGEPVADYLQAFDVDLFLSTSSSDAQIITDRHICPVAILKSIPETAADPIPDGQVRIAFDGDAVLFDEASELVYKEQGLDAFQKNEDSQQDVPLKEGPHASFLKKLSLLQGKIASQKEFSPIRIALVTARSYPAEMRAIKTLRTWNIYIDEAFFLGGVDKSKVLKAFRPHIFFDDQDSHLAASSKVVPSGKVLYESRSKLNRK